MRGFQRTLICLILTVAFLWQSKVFAADVFCKIEYYFNGTNNMRVILYSKTNKSYYVKGFTRDSDRQVTVYFSDKKTFSSESNSVLIPQSMFLLPVRVILMPSDGSLLFKDIKNSPYKDHILFLASIGKIDGYRDDTFKPKNNITRQEFVKLFVNVFDIKIEKNIKKYSFSDIQNCWAKSEIETLYKMGIITGMKDKQNRLVFKPNDGVTYEQAIAILARYLKLKSISKNDYNSWANQYINAFVDNQLISAEEIKGLKLNSFATREWIAYIFSKTIFK
ncbi:S-layer domain-containing protein [Caldicellulosiruptor owensensis OL]|uniref:S-layer domain-containing protein n=1 Tax=Caldicellulosiruptor owensensis (strain ATCC 700167 / DSM 13100 / OL) TaxID=632518 RepID=E4Q457_CALOW|nr:S-layer homology domain-containing protein [Caldicellulosiruptor owensensis]ADQ05211.1 S-layer domain-containing protein [Caldicellulosiruptor owensensis OL]